MRRAVVLGSGMVGSLMAADLAADSAFEVIVADRSEEALSSAVTRSGGAVRGLRVDLAVSGEIARAVEGADIVLGALSSGLGLRALRAVIEAGKNYCDISFMPENALDLDELARERGVTAVVDCGVAPGLSHMMAGYGVARIEHPESVEIYVGGLPHERRWPFEYKAGFAPGDVIEEYTRPARLVEKGQVVVREALSEAELIDLPGIGTLEAFNTDGLRSLIETLAVPNMKEKTLRYPGHIELMRVFRHAGLFSKKPVHVGQVELRPLDLFAALVFPQWGYEEGERDLTVMRVDVRGEGNAGLAHCRWDLIDHYDASTRATSMSRTTAFPCVIVARFIADGLIAGPGVFTPELIATRGDVFMRVLEDLTARGVKIAASIDL